MGYKVTIPFLQIGDYAVRTPDGLSELLAPIWLEKADNAEIDEFASQFTFTTFVNDAGRLVTRCKRRVMPNEHNQPSVAKNVR